MIIQRLAYRGLKAKDAEFDLGPVNAFGGENGTGKSAVIDALFLLATGLPRDAVGIPKTLDGVMSLARGDKVMVEADLIDALRFGFENKPVHIKRTWSRARDGKVSEKIETNLGGPTGVKEQRVAIGLMLGELEEAWRPGAILGLSPAKLRNKVIRIVPRDEISLDQIVPKDCPKWALPQSNPEPHEWVRYAIELAGDELKVAEAAQKVVQDRIKNWEDGWRGVESRGPLQAKLKALRDDLLKVRTGALLHAQIAKAATKVDEKWAVLEQDAPPVELARMVYAITEAATASIGETRRDVERVLVDLAAAERALRAECARFEGVPEAREADLKIALEWTERLQGQRDALIRTVETHSLEAERYEGLDLECPACGTGLRTEFERLRDVALDAMNVALDRLQAVEVDLAEYEARAEVTRLGVEKTTAEAALQNIAAQSDAIFASSPPVTDEDISSALTHASTMVDLAEARGAALDALTDSEAALGLLRGQLDDLGFITTLAAEEIEAEIRKVEGELEGLGAKNERAETLEAAEADAKDAEDKIAFAKAWQKRFAEIQTDLIARTKTAVESRITRVFGEQVEVSLVDARGNLDCRFSIPGRASDAATLSGGELARFLAALVTAIAETSQAKYRPLIVDGFEAISAAYRRPFLESVVATVNGGTCSQSFLSGCNDGWPEVEGVRFFRLGEERVETLEINPKERRAREVIDAIVGG